MMETAIGANSTSSNTPVYFCGEVQHMSVLLYWDLAPLVEVIKVGPTQIRSRPGPSCEYPSGYFKKVSRRLPQQIHR